MNTLPFVRGGKPGLRARYSAAPPCGRSPTSSKSCISPQIAERLYAGAEVVNGIRVAKFEMSVDPGFARNMALLLQKKAENLVLVGAYEFGGKPNLLAMYSNDLVAKGKNAGKDIREAAKLIQGGGGGQPGLATAGGRDTANLKPALEKLIELATA